MIEIRRINGSHVKEASLDLLAEMKDIVEVAELAQARIAPLPRLIFGQVQIAVMGDETVDE